MQNLTKILNLAFIIYNNYEICQKIKLQNSFTSQGKCKKMDRRKSRQVRKGKGVEKNLDEWAFNPQPKFVATSLLVSQHGACRNRTHIFCLPRPACSSLNRMIHLNIAVNWGPGSRQLVRCYGQPTASNYV